LSVSIIQAINRIRRRQVADTEGRGPSADIFIVLPRIETGDAMALAGAPRAFLVKHARLLNKLPDNEYPQGLWCPVCFLENF
jgi:hypothetical protein